MKRPYGIFAFLDGKTQFLKEASIRFPRANRAALEASEHYPGVFFAHFTNDKKPVGEHHVPTKVGVPTPRSTTTKQVRENLHQEIEERRAHQKRRQHRRADVDRDFYEEGVDFLRATMQLKREKQEEPTTGYVDFSRVEREVTQGLTREGKAK